MQVNNIAKARLVNQQISGTKFKTAKEIVGWMGAMQAQDFSMAKWALGIRLPGSTEKEIESAVSDGEIIRTHILRPTWHFVLPEDLNWMRSLSAPKSKTSLSSRDRALGLTEAIIKKSKKIIERALSKGEHLTGDELAVELERNKIDTGDYRAWHLFYKAELDGIICSGVIKNGKPTFALLHERVLVENKLKREEALGLLAKKYFLSHGPATLQDFAWWSGLNLGDSRAALEAVKSGLFSEVINKQTYWFTNSLMLPKHGDDAVYLLPAFDEFIISYKDRTATFPFGKQKKAISNNGIFKPVIVIGGEVLGIWKRLIKGNNAFAEAEYFRPVLKKEEKQINNAFNHLQKFLNKNLIVKGGQQ